MLDVLGNSPETFVFRGVDGGQLVLFGLLVALVPAAVSHRMKEKFAQPAKQNQ